MAECESAACVKFHFWREPNVGNLRRARYNWLGPPTGTAREVTGWDGFYAAMWLYYPLLVWGRDTPLDAYVESWVRLFGTVGPG